jgi:hypothetical protein
VVELWRASNKEHERRMRYRFMVEGRVFTATTKVPRAIWERLKVGAPLPVQYVPADPAINHPAEWERGATPAWLPFLFGPFFGGLGILMYWAIRRQWRLLGEGRPAPGVVTSVKRTDKAVIVKYEFRLLSGAVQKGRGSASSRKSFPGVGAVVCVLYDPDNPRRNALYPLQLVRMG